MAVVVHFRGKDFEVEVDKHDNYDIMEVWEDYFDQVKAEDQGISATWDKRDWTEFEKELWNQKARHEELSFGGD